MASEMVTLRAARRARAKTAFGSLDGSRGDHSDGDAGHDGELLRRGGVFSEQFAIHRPGTYANVEMASVYFEIVECRMPLPGQAL